jgi:hypothetical protein
MFNGFDILSGATGFNPSDIFSGINFKELPFMDYLNAGMSKVSAGFSKGNSSVMSNLMKGRMDISSIMSDGAGDMESVDGIKDMGINFGALLGGDINMNGLVDQKAVDYDLNGGYNRKFKFSITDIADMIAGKFYGIK